MTVSMAREDELRMKLHTVHKPWSMMASSCNWHSTWRSMWMWSCNTNVRLYFILSTDMPLYDHTKVCSCVCELLGKFYMVVVYLSLCNQGSIQLSVTSHTAGDRKLGGSGNETRLTFMQSWKGASASVAVNIPRVHSIRRIRQSLEVIYRCENDRQEQQLWNLFKLFHERDLLYWGPMSTGLWLALCNTKHFTPSMLPTQVHSPHVWVWC